jgi:hypothetical protein
MLRRQRGPDVSGAASLAGRAGFTATTRSGSRCMEEIWTTSLDRRVVRYWQPAWQFLLGRDRRELVRRAFTVAVFIGDVLAFDVSEVAQGLLEGPPHRRVVEDPAG